MLVNGRNAWTISLDIIIIIQVNVDSSKCRVHINKLMLNWVDPMHKTIVFPILSLLVHIIVSFPWTHCLEFGDDML